MGKITDYNLEQLEQSEHYEDANLEGLISRSDFCEYLNELIIEKKIRKTDIIKNTNISKSYLDDLLNYKKELSPSRNKILSLSISMGLTHEEINKLLRSANLPLLDSRREGVDTIIIWALAHDKNSDEIRELLYSKGYSDI